MEIKVHETIFFFKINLAIKNASNKNIFPKENKNHKITSTIVSVYLLRNLYAPLKTLSDLQALPVMNWVLLSDLEFLLCQCQHSTELKKKFEMKFL